MITVNLECSQLSMTARLSLDDLNLTPEEWGEMTETEKNSVLEDAVNELPEQPYWVIGNFNT